MRTYIIGTDGITLCREPPPAVNAGEIAVASNEELHAARLLHWLFRGLLSVHSRCGPHGPLTPRRGRFSECFRPFVAS